MKKLTIAIPTYNRNETLNETLVGLLPQLTESCQLILIDDHSPRPVTETVNGVLARYPDCHVEIRRNRWNLGLVANVLRCFELCDTEWIWVPGDDDRFSPEAIRRIFTVIEENPRALYCNFVTKEIEANGDRKETIKSYGVKGFAESLDMAGLVNFMSCSVWRTEAFGNSMSCGFQYAYSTGWTFALLLSGLGDGGESILSQVAIIESATTAPTTTRWSLRKFILGWPTLLEIPPSSEIRQNLAKKMLDWLSPENVTAYLLADAATRTWPGRFFYIDLAVGRLCPYRVHRLGRLRYAIYRPLFWTPRIGWKVVRATINMANRLGLKRIDVADMEGRSDS